MNELREEIELPILMNHPEDTKKAAQRWPDPIDVAATQRMFTCLLGRERQLKSPLAANREQKAEIERLTALEFTLQAQRDLLFWVVKAIADAQWRKWGDGLNTPQDFIAWAKSLASKAVADTEKLASLRSSVGEKPENAYARGFDAGYELARAQSTGRATLASRYYVAPPSLPIEKGK